VDVVNDFTDKRCPARFQNTQGLLSGTRPILRKSAPTETGFMPGPPCTEAPSCPHGALKDDQTNAQTTVLAAGFSRSYKASPQAAGAKKRPRKTARATAAKALTGTKQRA